MTERLNLGQIALLITYAAGMAAGQLLFKAAALRLSDGHPLPARALLLLQDAPFIGAIVLYAALSVLWVWLLTFTAVARLSVRCGCVCADAPPRRAGVRRAAFDASAGWNRSDRLRSCACCGLMRHDRPDSQSLGRCRGVQ